MLPVRHNIEYEIKPMADLLAEMMGDELAPEDLSGIPMYVLTNKNRIYGATGMLNGKAIQQCSELLGDRFYILPSSVHELILIPDAGDPACLTEMVREINRTVLTPNDFLSDMVYVYDNGHVGIARDAIT